jgi:hypothetical protein
MGVLTLLVGKLLTKQQSRIDTRLSREIFLPACPLWAGTVLSATRRCQLMVSIVSHTRTKFS